MGESGRLFTVIRIWQGAKALSANEVFVSKRVVLGRLKVTILGTRSLGWL